MSVEGGAMGGQPLEMKNERENERRRRNERESITILHAFDFVVD